jgi:hypothetical protein
MTKLFVLKQGVPYGPYTSRELHDQVHNGFFQNTNYVSSSGCGGRWWAISEFDQEQANPRSVNRKQRRAPECARPRVEP